MKSKYSASDQFTYINKNVIEKRIQELNSSLDEVAKKSGLSSFELYDFITHKTRVSAFYRKKLAKVLNVSPSKLVDYYPEHTSISTNGYYSLSAIARKTNCTLEKVKKTIKALKIPVDVVKNNANLYSRSKVDRIVSYLNRNSTNTNKTSQHALKHHSENNNTVELVIYTTLNSILKNQIINQKETIKELKLVNSNLEKVANILCNKTKHWWRR